MQVRDRLVVKPEDLRRRLDPATLPFSTTAAVAPVSATFGQPRAVDAISFGLEVDVHHLVQERLREYAAQVREFVARPGADPTPVGADR